MTVTGEPSQIHAPTTMGDCDGPETFVDSLGESVGTYIDPRLDLIADHFNSRRFVRLQYHVPFSKRGIYKPEWLPHEFFNRIRGSIRTDLEGYVICGGTSKVHAPNNHSKQIGTKPCSARAVNRSGFCRNHGGALHPADKKMSAQNLARVPEDRVEQLDRVQKFMQGFLSFDELSDEEVIGAFVYNDQGRPISSAKLGDKIHQGITRELFVRMNRFMQMKLPNMLKRISEIAESDIVEPETQLKAAIWMSERTMGKTPEILIHGKTDAPYEGILQQVATGRRDEHRALRERRALGMATDGNGSNDIQRSNGANIIEGEVVEPQRHDAFDGDLESGEGEPEPDWVSGSDGDNDASDAGISGTGDGETDSGSDSRSLDAVVTRIENAKDARDRIKGARQRRFAARANGAALDSTLDQTPWAVEFKPIQEGCVITLGGEKFRVRAYRAKFFAPLHQTEAVLDRIKTRQVAYAAGDRDVVWRNDTLSERNEDGSFPE